MSRIADIIMRGTEMRSEAYEKGTAARLQGLSDIGKSIAEIPSLIKEGREERDLKAVNEAITAAGLAQDEDSAVQTLS